MTPSLKRSACAALMLAFVPAAVSAATPQANVYPAIATGLAIPNHSAASRSNAVRPAGRSVLIDAASAQLYMIEDGRIADSMKVIVGKPTAATPSLTSTLNYATLNPYWNVPPDLARSLIAPRVLAEGQTYLDDRGYEVVASFEDPRAVPADSVDWAAVAAGRETVFVRQRPGPANSMGQMKFNLASSDGIYLHDTPKKELFAEDMRNISNGCVRLEDAPRFARWLLGGEAKVGSAPPEQHVRLQRPVKVVITYLDAGARMQLAALR